MIKKRKSSITIALSIVIPVLLFFGFWFYFMNMFKLFRCGNDIIEALSWKGYSILAFLRNCGATTDYSVHVSILPEGEKLQNDDVGNVFSARRSSFIDFELVSESNLLIYYDCPDDHIITKKEEFHGIIINYQKK